MRDLDIAIVRLAPIIFFICIGFNIYNSWNGEYTLFSIYLHPNSALYALSLFLISLANKKYHCIWNRAMYLELIAFPLINYLDAKYNLFPDVVLYLRIVTYIYVGTLIATLFLAINHFIKKRRNRYKEYKLK